MVTHKNYWKQLPNVSQDRFATRSRRDEIFNDDFISTFIRQKKADNNKQIDIQNRWTDSVDRQNDKLIKYNTTKHSIKTEFIFSDK